MEISTLENWLWDAACAIRGPLDAPKFKDYILPLLFFKRLSDVYQDELGRLTEEFGDPAFVKELVEQDRSLVRFYLPDEYTWDRVRQNPTALVEKLTVATRAIARENSKLEGVIDRQDFNATESGQRVLDDGSLARLMEILNRQRLGLKDVEPDILGRAYGLANPHEQAIAIRDEVGFFQAVKAGLVKTITTPMKERGKSPEEIDKEIQAIVDRAVAPDGVIDMFEVAGLPQPDISILSDEFLMEVEALPVKNVALELLRRLIEDELRARRRRNLVQSRSFAAMLQDTLKRYNEQKETAAKIIGRLIGLAKEMREAERRGEELGLAEDELAFYDALEVNDSAVAVLGDETLKEIAQELVKQVRANISIDWTLKESAQAKMRVTVKRILRNMAIHRINRRRPRRRWWLRPSCCQHIGRMSDEIQCRTIPANTIAAPSV